MITLIGFLGEYALKLRIVKLMDRMLEGLPLGQAHLHVRQGCHEVSHGQRRKGFSNRCYLRLSLQEEVRRVGFVTDEALRDLRPSQ